MRRLTTFSLICVISLANGLAWSQSAKPNVVVIMADDLDQNMTDRALAMGWMPNLKNWIINKGTSFKNSFVPYSLCCPSRASYLSGQYNHNNGVKQNGTSQGGCAAFQDSTALPVWVKNAGYRTGHIGKYLNGYGQVPTASPATCSNPNYVPPGYDHWQGTTDPSTYQMYGYQIHDTTSAAAVALLRPPVYQTDYIALRAAQFIQGSAALGKPFFLTLTPIAPHIEVPQLAGCQTNFGPALTVTPAPRHQGSAASVPLPKPPSYSEENVQDKPPYLQTMTTISAEQSACMEKTYRNRLESLRAVDDLIGAVAAALSSAEVLANTALVFTSDNGFMHGEHRLSQKTYPYEESLRVPLYIRPPGGQSPKTSELFALNIDLAPTIAEWAQAAPARAVDGRSLKPILDGQAPAAWRKRFLSEFWNTIDLTQNGETAPRIYEDIPVDGPGGLAELYPQFPWGAMSVTLMPTYAGVRTSALDALPNRLYVEYAGVAQSKELYDLNLDPYQLQSLHNLPGRAGERDTLSRWIAALRACGGGPSSSAGCQILDAAASPPGFLAAAASSASGEPASVETAAAPAAADLSEARVFPNPLRPALGHAAMNFANLPPGARVRLYTLAGENVADLSADGSGATLWDGKNGAGSGVGSGVYFALLEGGGEKKILKVVIQR